MAAASPAASRAIRNLEGMCLFILESGVLPAQPFIKRHPAAGSRPEDEPAIGPIIQLRLCLLPAAAAIRSAALQGR